MNSLGKLLLRGLWRCYSLAIQTDEWLDGFSDIGNPSYETVHRALLDDDEFLNILEKHDQVVNSFSLQKAEDVILSRYIRPAYQKFGYVYARNTEARVFECRYQRSKKFDVNALNTAVELYKQTAEFGEPWSANKYGQMIESTKLHGKTSKDQISHKEMALHYYHLAAFQYPSDKPRDWALFNYIRLAYEYTGELPQGVSVESMVGWLHDLIQRDANAPISKSTVMRLIRSCELAFQYCYTKMNPKQNSQSTGILQSTIEIYMRFRENIPENIKNETIGSISSTNEILESVRKKWQLE